METKLTPALRRGCGQRMSILDKVECRRCLSSPSRPEEERNHDEGQEDEAERVRKKEYEEEKKKNQEESKNCMEILSRDHAYLDSGGVEPGLETSSFAFLFYRGWLALQHLLKIATFR
jgi:hypothetical protein